MKTGSRILKYEVKHKELSVVKSFARKLSEVECAALWVMTAEEYYEAIVGVVRENHPAEHWIIITAKVSVGRGGKREGAGRPPKYPEGVTDQVTVQLPWPMVDKIDELAKEHGQSRSGVVCALLRKMLKD